MSYLQRRSSTLYKENSEAAQMGSALHMKQSEALYVCDQFISHAVCECPHCKTRFREDCIILMHEHTLDSYHRRVIIQCRNTKCGANVLFFEIE